MIFRFERCAVSKERKQVTPRRNRGQGCALHRFPQGKGEKTEKPHEN